MSQYGYHELQKFKEAFYSRMDKVSRDHIHHLSHRISQEAQSFVDAYSKDIELIKEVNGVVASFLDDFEKRLLDLKTNKINKMLVDSD